MRAVSKSHGRVLGSSCEGCEGQEYAYHVMSLTAGGEFLFGDEEKEVLRKLIWNMSAFFGVKVLTYWVMDNHFHLLVRVRDGERFGKKFYGESGEGNLLKHLELIYSKAFIRKRRKEIDHLRTMELGAELSHYDLLRSDRHSGFHF